MAVIPRLDELPAPPRRIILHWTGGGHRANEVDRKAYHYVVEHDGNVVQGVHAVADNMQRVWGDRYARHTGGFNSFSAGISFAGMKDAVNARSPGPAPLKEGQVLAGLRFAAACCDAWGLDPQNPAHLFHHREAWELHGVKGEHNHTKPDITYLPFLPELTRTQTGPWLRARVAEFLRGNAPAVPIPVPGERRWSPSLGWIRLARYVSDDEWYFRPESQPHSRNIRAGARWSEMPLGPG